MNPLIKIRGLEEYPAVSEAYERMEKLLDEIAECKAVIDEHKAGVEFLKAEKGRKFDELYRSVDEALEERIAAGRESVEMYERLLKTPLYDKARMQWNWGMEENKVYAERLSHVQLSGVIALASIGRMGEAEEMYDRLAKTPLYEKSSGLWHFNMSEAQELKVDSFPSFSQLSGVVALAMIGREYEAAKLYKYLEGTVLYDIALRQWNNTMNNLKANINTQRNSYSCLYGVLALNLAGRKEESVKAYNMLMQSPLYDASCRQWNEDMTEKQELIHSERKSPTQMVGILCMTGNGMIKEADKAYNGLAETLLYDKKMMLWRNEISAEQDRITNNNIDAPPNLLAVAALAALGR